MDSCCQDKSREIDRLRERQSKVLWIVLGINVCMFALEVTVGLLSGSTALLADSLDMLGDALVYGFSLYVVLAERGLNGGNRRDGAGPGRHQFADSRTP